VRKVRGRNDRGLESFITCRPLLIEYDVGGEKRGYEGWTCDTRANRRAGSRV
jgi:hypothetical protein